MSTRPERPAPSSLAHPGDPTSAELSIARPDSVRLANARSALSECSGAISLLQVTVRSLESQDIACAEQEVLTQAIETLCSLRDWLHDRMWSETEAEHACEREHQP